MKNSGKELFNSYFSHIYIEEKALEHINTKKILGKFPQGEKIIINHYKDIFSRTGQDFNMQKKSPKLILAIKEDNYIYKGAEPCENFGNDNFYYTSTLMNCLYNCEYCYLKGMYSSSNIVIFVNIEDIFQELDLLLEKHPVYLCISYDTDLMALEYITGYTNKWLEFAKERNNLKVELRTKSANFKSIEKVEVNENIILAWTLSPQEIIEKYEHNTANLENRLRSMKEAINKGWKVRLCIDPIIYIDKWEIYYGNLVEAIKENIDLTKINDISLGFFRVSKDYLKIMKKQDNQSLILNYPFENIDSLYTYPREVQEKIRKYILVKFETLISRDKIYFD